VYVYKTYLDFSDCIINQDIVEQLETSICIYATGIKTTVVYSCRHQEQVAEPWLVDVAVSKTYVQLNTIQCITRGALHQGCTYRMVGRSISHLIYITQYRNVYVNVHVGTLSSPKYDLRSYVITVSSPDLDLHVHLTEIITQVWPSLTLTFSKY